MTVSENGKHLFELEGRRYLFCGSICKKAFASNPGKYLDPRHVPSKSGALMDWLRNLLRVRSV